MLGTPFQPLMGHVLKKKSIPAQGNGQKASKKDTFEVSKGHSYNLWKLNLDSYHDSHDKNPDSVAQNVKWQIDMQISKNVSPAADCSSQNQWDPEPGHKDRLKAMGFHRELSRVVSCRQIRSSSFQWKPCWHVHKGCVHHGIGLLGLDSSSHEISLLINTITQSF